MTHTDFAQARFNMVEQQIRPWDVLEPAVLAVLTEVPREEFVPAEHRALSFMDLEVPLSAGSAMLSPKVQARLVHDLTPKPSDKVLEIGTGSGYTAALLGRLAQQVISLEIDPGLASAARDNLQAAGIANVQVRAVDGAQGLPTEGPFDIILVSGSVPRVPQHLLAQLAPGGRLAAIVGDEPVMRATFVTREGEAFQTRQPWDTVAPRLQGFPEPSRFSF